MGHKRKGQLTTTSEWHKHLRNYLKREFWKGERRAEKSLILEELDKISAENQKKIPVLIELFESNKIDYKIMGFDSGCSMIDFELNDRYFCIQLEHDQFGWSEINEDTGFGTFPDSGYLEWSTFLQQISDLIGVEIETQQLKPKIKPS
jgi:hypothetical protein